jgi:hypothetical protein
MSVAATTVFPTFVSVPVTKSPRIALRPDTHARQR